MSTLETKTLQEIFRTTLNKGKGDLFQTILNHVDHSAQLHDIQTLLRQYADNVDLFRTQVIADKEKNTVRKAGVEVGSHEVLCEYLNRRGDRLKAVLK